MPLPVLMDATWLDGAVQFNGLELRRSDTALFNGDGSPLGVRGGIVRHGDSSLAVTVNASDQITIQPGAAVIPGNVGVANGVYRAALPAAETGQLDPRNATNPRIDRVVFRVLDTSVVNTHGAFTGRVEVLAGAPSATPANTMQDLPSLAIELARVTVPATGGGAATVDSSFRQYASALGGVLPVSTVARLPAAPNAKWLRAVALDTGREYTWDGNLWLSGIWTAYTPIWTGTGGNPVLGNGSLSGRFQIINQKTMLFYISLGIGSTTTFGAGRWEFSLPHAPIGYADGFTTFGRALVRDAGTRNYGCDVVFTSPNRVHLWRDAGAAEATVTPTTPMPWAASDFMTLLGTCEIS